MLLKRHKTPESDGVRTAFAFQGDRPVGRVVLVVSTPHQLLNALEAVDSMGLTPSAVFLLNLGYSLSAFGPFMESMRSCEVFALSTGKSDERTVVSWTKGRLASRLAMAILRAQMFLRGRTLGCLDTLVIGRYDHPAHLALLGGLRQVGQIVVVDDGTSTLSIDPALRQTLTGTVFDRNCSDKVVLFTQFSTAIAPPEVKVMAHSYERWKRSFDRTRAMSGTWITGMPLVEDGLVSAATYQHLLTRVLSNVPTPHVYLPHPREKQFSTLVRRLSLEVLVPQSIIEVEFVQADPMPAAIAGLPSTSLFSLNHISSGHIPVTVLSSFGAVQNRAARVLARVVQEACTRRNFHQLEW